MTILLLINTTIVFSNQINTLDITTHTVAAFPKCSKYKVTGMCFWGKCIGPVCYVTNTTLKVSHYLPDAVATVFNEKGQNPWLETRLYDEVSYPIGNKIIGRATGTTMAGGEQSHPRPVEDILTIREANLIGHPLSFFWQAPFFIRSKATPFKPYFESMKDAFSWRMPVESLLPQSLMFATYALGNFPLSMWGTVYPRDGITDNPNDAKAASVIAFRAAHIATRRNQPHVYWPLASGDCGQKCNVWPVNHNDDNHHWQMLYPIAENECRPIAYNDATQPKEWGLSENFKDKDAYAWNLWRKYEGCIQGSGKLIVDISY